MDLGGISNFLNTITADVTSAYKTFTSPSQVPIPGSQVPGRPGFVYGFGGSIQPVNPATGGLLPPVNSGVGGTPTMTTIILVAALGLLGLAFLLSIRK